MDSYIVRVYKRFNDSFEDEVAGQIEEVGIDQTTSFKTITGLVTNLRRIIGRDGAKEANVLEFCTENASSKE